jgi:glycosyltransferase involved in cell wall biosynthesis
VKLSFLRKTPKYDLSVVVIIYNMQREAQRTLYSLSRKYQHRLEEIRYETIVIDNGSSEPLDKEWVESFGDGFRYVYFNADSPSPCKALNHGVEIASGKLVTVCIDGARMLSPGILYYSMLAGRVFSNPLVYTLAMHIGKKVQNYLAEENYSQSDEDNLLNTIDWKKDGYSLFDVSSVALSSGDGYLSELRESNCMTMLKSTYNKLGGYDERYTGPGGGLVNLDFFNRINQSNDIDLIMLLGEATFHQFHGGVATNVPLERHPWPEMAKEYERIHGKPFQYYYKDPIYFGKIHSKCRQLFPGGVQVHQ